jgi:predicted DNA-binding protein
MAAAVIDNTGTGIYGHSLSETGTPPRASGTPSSIFQAGRSSGTPATMSRKKISTTIYITPEQNDRLKLLHERTKVPIAVYIREGIDMVLKHYEHVLPGQMSLEAAGQKKS